ncbi:unnamed protein product [Phaedon cochleariae]|uniref:Phorbol-ester/DAG-type domain-containing protein n=1 Tax=Phaedon cochleariae TaxID=80249 RepID=A0A9N9SDM8_PHACE|nr:unnamed protein product [Phaedon cochleariae]
MPDKISDSACQLANCARCRNPVKTGSKCSKCGVLSHNSCLKALKNVQFFKDGTVICCQENENCAPIDKDSDSVSINDTQNEAADKITIKFMEQLLKQKDLTITNQEIAIKSLTEQIVLLKEKLLYASNKTDQLAWPPVSNQVQSKEKRDNQKISSGNSTATSSKKQHIAKTDLSSAVHKAETQQLCQQIIDLDKGPSTSTDTKNSRRILVGNKGDPTGCPFKASTKNIRKSDLHKNLRYFHVTNLDTETDETELLHYLKNFAPNVQVENPIPIKMTTRNKIEVAAIVKESINEFFLDKEFISQLTKKISERIEQKIRRLEEEVKTQGNKINILEQKVDSFQQQLDAIHQRAKMNNICIYGVAEENNEDLLNKVLDMINSKTNMTLNTNDIMDAYRVGQPHEIPNKPRPTIIKMARPQLKSEIFKCGSKFKGSNIYINEDLTKLRRSLLMEAKSVFGVKSVWSFNGQIYATINGKKTKLIGKDDITKYRNI